MPSILIYAIKSAILLTLLFVPGIFFVFREKMFHFNRFTLLTILVLSLTLPLCNFSLLSMDNVPAVQTIERGLIELGVPVEVTTYIPIEDIKTQEKTFPWFYIVSILYAIGVMTVLSLRLYEVFSMGHIIRKGSIWKKDDSDGIHIYCHAEKVAPFCWLKSIVISEDDYKENGQEIILHEKAHILYHHSLDIILLTLVEVVQWWNPFVYLLGIHLRDVHEYEADDYVLLHDISIHSYSELLIKKAIGASSYTFSNNFNHSLTKKRISMMHKTTSKLSRRYRVLYVLPMIVITLSAFATPEFQTASDFIEQTISNRSNTFTLKGTVAEELNVDKFLIYIWDYANNVDWPQPIDSVYVKSGKFEYSKSLDQPYSGMLQIIHKDGTKGKFFLEFLFVPGEDCKIDVKGEGLNEFTLGGSKFYSDWEAFAQFYKKEYEKAIALQGAGDDAFFASIADYNRKHKDEEGCIMYQYMWRHANMDFSIADGIKDGRFSRYIIYRKLMNEMSKEEIRKGVFIYIDSESKLYIKKKNENQLNPVSPKELLETLSEYKYEPITIDIISEKEIDNMENMVKEACRKNNLLKINYQVIHP